MKFILSGTIALAVLSGATSSNTVDFLAKNDDASAWRLPFGSDDASARHLPPNGHKQRNDDDTTKDIIEALGGICKSNVTGRFRT
jgi:hypothetical protein